MGRRKQDDSVGTRAVPRAGGGGRRKLPQAAVSGWSSGALSLRNPAMPSAGIGGLK
jgi:hypothetical protein